MEFRWFVLLEEGREPRRHVVVERSREKVNLHLILKSDDRVIGLAVCFPAIIEDIRLKFNLVAPTRTTAIQNAGQLKKRKR